MKHAVANAWHLFSEPLEGRVHSMYLDVKGLITTGVGNLIDPVSLAVQLPWKHANSGFELASKGDVVAAWNELKGRQELAKMHWKYAAKLNDLRLTDEDVDRLVEQKLLEFEAHLKKHHFPDWDAFPADGQLGIMSMSWACGPGFPSAFKNFKAAVMGQNWEAARASCKIRETGNPGVVPRNAANRTCFSNAAVVVANGMDRDRLHWPEHAVPELDRTDMPLAPAIPPENWIGDPLGLPDDVFDDLQNIRKEQNRDD